MNPDLSDSRAQLGKMSSQDLLASSNRVPGAGLAACVPALVVPETTFCFKSLPLGSWTLGLQKSWVVETGSPSPSAFASTVAAAWGFRGPWDPRSTCLPWSSSSFVVLTSHPPALTQVGLQAQPQGASGTKAWQGSPHESWDTVSSAQVPCPRD